MTRLSPSAFDQAGEVYLVANTPTFLYKRLRQNALVQEIGTGWKTEDIIEQLSFYAGEGVGKEEACIALYVFLIALSFKPLAEYRAFLEELNPPARWVPELRRLILDNATANRILTASIGTEPVHQPPVSASNTVSRNIILGKG